MKNPVLSAGILVAAAGLVGWIAWSATTDDRIESEAPVVTPQASLATPKVTTLTPHELRMEKRLEGARRKIERAKKDGEVLENGEIKLVDANGTVTYMHPKLVEGVGRYGEPTYALVEYARKPAPPLTEPKMIIKDPKGQPRVKRLPAGKSVITLGTKADGNQGSGLSGATGGSGGASKGNKGQGKKPGKPKDN